MKQIVISNYEIVDLPVYRKRPMFLDNNLVEGLPDPGYLIFSTTDEDEATLLANLLRRQMEHTLFLGEYAYTGFLKSITMETHKSIITLYLTQRVKKIK